MAAAALNVIAAEETKAGNSFGIVTGRVTDTEDHILPGATVMIEDLHTGVTSDINGYYTLPNLQPGTYTIKVSYVGYSPITQKVTVRERKVQETNIRMNEGVELQEINVKGAFAGQRRALQIQKNSMGIVNVVSADQIGKFLTLTLATH